ncbi:MAG TPA: hypothetical protein VHR45_11165 [Thermoanaerobaculia bacterium]|nr:hypothetical protein [Thermoanaerobaculia bacterium]
MSEFPRRPKEERPLRRSIVRFVHWLTVFFQENEGLGWTGLLVGILGLLFAFPESQKTLVRTAILFFGWILAVGFGFFLFILRERKTPLSCLSCQAVYQLSTGVPKYDDVFLVSS